MERILPMNKQFLVVFEDVWSNKESYQTSRIGDTIKMIVEANDLVPFDHIDYDKYNSDKPYQMGTFGEGFYDISFNDKEDEYAGRIMIFELEQWK
jgi:hypothetical protein